MIFCFSQSKIDSLLRMPRTRTISYRRKKISSYYSGGKGTRFEFKAGVAAMASVRFQTSSSLKLTGRRQTTDAR
jgi:hypothetical protein